MLTQQHFIFKVDGRMNVSVSAPTQDLARERLARHYDAIEYVGLNSRLENYEFEPMTYDWLTRPINTIVRSIKSVPTIFKAKPKKLTRIEELMEQGLDHASASVAAAMEQGVKG
jgi:hypothetical protein